MWVLLMLLDIAKSVFQVHGIDAEGKVLIRRKLKHRYVLAFFEKLQPCLVGIEACATSHHQSYGQCTRGVYRRDALRHCGVCTPRHAGA
jgi:hypothetical protein